jgi:hypothetical protein
VGKAPENVELKKHPVRWRKLPLTIRRELTAQAEKVGMIRSDIAASSHVSWMPPVRVIDAGWLTPKRVIFGPTVPASVTETAYSLE